MSLPENFGNFSNTPSGSSSSLKYPKPPEECLPSGIGGFFGESDFAKTLSKPAPLPSAKAIFPHIAAAANAAARNANSLLFIIFPVIKQKRRSLPPDARQPRRSPENSTYLRSRTSVTFTGNALSTLCSTFSRIFLAISRASMSPTASGETMTRNSLPACIT